MSANSRNTVIQSHTEYVRTRIRCPACGENVPVERSRDQLLCVRCENTG